MLDAPGFAARLSLVDAEGQPLVQSDGPATGAGDGLIDVNVPAGTDFLEVQSLFGEGTYQITADLIPTVPPFQTVTTDFSGYPPIAAGNFYGASFPVDLVAPDGIHVGNGDGTFQSTPVAGPLAQSGWTVTAIAVGDFSQDNLPDIAFTEISPDRDQLDGPSSACSRMRAGASSSPARRCPSIPNRSPSRRSTLATALWIWLWPTRQEILRFSWVTARVASRRGQSSPAETHRPVWSPVDSGTATLT